MTSYPTELQDSISVLSLQVAQQLWYYQRALLVPNTQSPVQTSASSALVFSGISLANGKTIVKTYSQAGLQSTSLETLMKSVGCRSSKTRQPHLHPMYKCTQT